MMLKAIRQDSSGNDETAPQAVYADASGRLRVRLGTTDPTIASSTTVTIGAGASLSGAADLTTLGQLVGLVTASTWDAAVISFAVSVNGTDYFPLRYNGSEFSEPNPGASQYVALNPAVFAGIKYVKVRSGVSTAATNQVDATVVTLVCRPV